MNLLVQILVYVETLKVSTSKLVVGSLYDCVVVAQQNLRSQIKIVLYSNINMGQRWPSASGVKSNRKNIDVINPSIILKLNRIFCYSVVKVQGCRFFLEETEKLF